MFCSQCGSRIEEGAKFCSACGVAQGNNETVNRYTDQKEYNEEPEEEIIDLSGQVEVEKPQEKKYKPTLVTAILATLVIFTISVTGFLFSAFVMEGATDFVFMSMLIVSIPYMLIESMILLHVKKKAKLTQRKFTNGKGVVFAIVILMISLTQVAGFSYAFSSIGLVGPGAFALFFGMAIVFIVLSNAVSNQNGIEGLYGLHQAILLGLILSAPLGWVLGKILGLFEIGIVIVIVGFVLFFILGGRVFFVRRR